MFVPDGGAVIFVRIIGDDGAATYPLRNAAHLRVIVAVTIVLVAEGGVAGDLVVARLARIFVVGLGVGIAVHLVHLLDHPGSQPGENGPG